MPLAQAFECLGIALALGMLVGLQRERAGSVIAGVRTFPLLCMLGAAAGIVGAALGTGATIALAASGMIGVLGLAIIGNLTRPASTEAPGVTTEAAMLLVNAAGLMVVTGPREAAIALAAVTAVLLQLKPSLHALVRNLDERDVRAIMQFAVIALIILPMVPNTALGPGGAINPYRVWLVVVLVVSISLLGYVAYRILGDRKGSLLAGLLGGLVSSTATTVSFARRSKTTPAAAGTAAVATLLAGAVVYGRLLVEIYAVAPAAFFVMAWPIATLLVVAIVLAGVAYVMNRSDGDTHLPPMENPTELKAALFFAALFAGVLLASAWASRELGHAGLLAVAAVSGLTDMDAITLSSAKLVADGAIPPHEGTRAILVAAIANGAFKTGIVLVLGAGVLRTRFAVLTGVKLLVAAGLAIAL